MTCILVVPSLPKTINNKNICKKLLPSVATCKIISTLLSTELCSSLVDTWLFLSEQNGKQWKDFPENTYELPRKKLTIDKIRDFMLQILMKILMLLNNLHTFLKVKIEKKLFNSSFDLTIPGPIGIDKRTRAHYTS